jgi:hypothetical protein
VILLEAEHTKLVFDEMANDHHIDVLLHCSVVGATTEDRQVRSVTCAEDRGTFEVSAVAFVDASGNTKLAAMSGAAMLELPSDKRQLGSLVLRFGGVERDNGRPDRAASLSELAAAIESANVGRSIPLPLPYGFVGRLPITNDLIAIVVDLDVDAVSAQSLTQAEMEGRRLAWEYLEVFRRSIAEFSYAYLSSIGPEIGIRQGRQIASRRPATGGDARTGVPIEDMIAQAGWPMEFHLGDGSIRYESIGGPGWFGIGYRALLPEDIDNLWLAGRTIGADHDAYGSIRVMGTSFATGHAAGIGAALWADQAKHDSHRVQSILETQGAALKD